MTKLSNREVQESLEEAPQWLKDALETLRVSPEFRNRCREAAHVAHSMAVLRKNRERVGLKPLPLHRYLNELAKTSGVKLAPILRWLGIRDLADPQPAEGRAYARLAKDLGMPQLDLHRHVAATLGLAENQGAFAIGNHSSAHVPANAAELMAQIEAELSPGARQRLQLISAEAAKEFDSGT